ncbi:MAG: HAMP domain-containing protein, partial [Pseudomonadota bacterium]
MFRLTLSRQLALIFAGAMILTQLAVLALDRWYTTSQSETRTLAVSRSLSANIIKVLPEMPEDLRALTVRSFSIRGSQFFLLPEPVAGPDAEALPELAAETMDWVERRELPVTEVFAAQYFFPHTGGFINRVRGTVQDELPRVFSAGDPAERRMFDVVGEAPLWVPLPPPLGHPPIPGRLERAESIVYYPVVTVAFRLEATGEWLTAYSYLRRPGNNDLVTKLYFSMLAMLVIAAVALLIGRRLMRPFRKLAKSAEQLGRGERGEDIPISGPSDMRAVVQSFNRMNGRVSQSIDYQIGLLRSLGHDLKGPLAAATKLLADVKPESTREQIKTRLERVRGIVDAIMSFSRAVMRDGLMQRTDLAELVETLV